MKGDLLFSIPSRRNENNSTFFELFSVPVQFISTGWQLLGNLPRQL